MRGVKADMLLADIPARRAGAAKVFPPLAAVGAALVPGGAFYLFYAEADTLRLRVECREGGWEIRQGLVWMKGVPLLDSFDYGRSQETCLYGWKDGAPHSWFSDRCQTTAMEFEAVDGAKPVELIKYLIANSCPPGGLVLDPCAGTGVTVIAAEASGMRACLAEARPAACDVIRRRWAEFVHGAGCDSRALTPAVSERGAPWAVANS